MYSDLEHTLIRELDDVASKLVVPPLPHLPVTSSGRRRWQIVAPLLVAAAVVVVVLAVAVMLGSPQSRDPAPAPSPTRVVDTGPLSTAAPASPVVVTGSLFVGGEEVPGRWSRVEGSGTHWVGQRAAGSGPDFVGSDGAGSWWWGYDTEPQELDRALDQPPAISPSGGYLAQVVSQGGGALLVGADTEEGGEGFGGVDLPDGDPDPAPRAVAVTDDGLVVARGFDFQQLWRPLVDGEVIDLAETAPGQVVIGNTTAGLLVNGGAYSSADGTQGAPYLAQLSEDGALIRVGAVPTHDVLEASREWLGYVPPGTVGGEASGTTELRVQRIDGSESDVLSPPEGWLFMAPGFSWENDDRLLALVVTQNGGDEALVRCRPAPASCAFVDLP
ncbi:hypothetical protein CF8_4123 [Nocardioides sp. CF8]|uniref:hypothetical protein n=1 Tax=Nocardioides sp. CF8 TaxID=110319 RepID=UPI00032EDA19|nr:hypothetical protein [Nocardioides sp. CF8]EON22029.1 hypothetical protein CF8_4123 [Nocardioides sp. CF8]